MKRGVWIIILLLLVIGVGIIPFSLLRMETHTLNLYFGGESSTAPVVITFSAISHYPDTDVGFYTDLSRAYQVGGAGLSGEITLSLGMDVKAGKWGSYSIWEQYYSKTKTAQIYLEVIDTEFRSGKTWNTYHITLSAHYDIGASEVVSNMRGQPWGTELERATKGSMQFIALYSLEYGKATYSGEASGSVQIEISPEIANLPGDDPEDQLQDIPEDSPPSDSGEDLDLSDNTVKDDTGASSFISGVMGVGQGLSIPLLAGVVIIALIIAFKHR